MNLEDWVMGFPIYSEHQIQELSRTSLTIYKTTEVAQNCNIGQVWFKYAYRAILFLKNDN